MRKVILILVGVFALVTAMNKAYAGALDPNVGDTITYSWNNVYGTTHEFFVSTAAPDTVGALVNSGTGCDAIFQIVASETTSGARNNQTASFQIVWGAAAASHSGSYYVWIEVTSADDCKNYRYVPVAPPVNNVEFNVIALGLYAIDEDVATLEAINSEDAGPACPDTSIINGWNWDSNGSPADGDVYAYFSVSKTGGSCDDWEFDVNESEIPDVTATVSYWDGSSWESIPGAGITGIGDTEVQLVRVRLATPAQSTTLSAPVAITISLTDDQEENGLTSDAGDETATFTVNRVGGIGGFSGN